MPRFSPHHLAGGPQQPPQGGQQDRPHDRPQVRGGHPEQHEPGGGWGTPGYDTGSFRAAGDTGSFRPVGDTGSFPAVGDTGGGRYGDWVGAPRGATAYAPPQVRPPGGLGAGARVPGQRTAGPQAAGPRAPQAPGGPRRDFMEAFDGPRDPAQAPGRERPAGRDPFDAVTDWDDAKAVGGDLADPDGTDPADGADAPRTRRHLVRTATGVSAAVVTVALAVVVAGQRSGTDANQKETAAPGVGDRPFADGASRDEERATPQGGAAPAAPPTYEQRMAQKLRMAADQKGPNTFDTVPGKSPAPGRGKVWKYRVDVEKGMGLDGKFFADAVQKTLNDKRSWAGDGEMTFERVSTDKADFVVTLATPVTTDIWCEKSSLNTLEQNVSCDSAATERVMINAFRWAGGSPTFGDDKLFAYRQMLINHEVGHRLGHNHRTCDKNGALAPVMMQQTKTLQTGSDKCRPNPWVHPGS
ncbi:DUF3152 domain-containing protein [Streptomyces sp. NPDC004111]|uniref:DUF3152 domain-containing protein n=1 Tax=Streptomyces sp. NPDC004111 TaxID=3364690 RepID=UPI0036B790C4